MSGTSSSPAVNGISGSSSHTQQRPLPKKKVAANPLVSNRRSQKPKPNSAHPPRPNRSNAPGQRTSSPATTHNNPTIARPDFATRRPSPEPEGTHRVFPVYLAPAEELDNIRYHLVRLQSRDKVDVTDQKTFERPVKLLRRDPLAKSGPVEDSDVDMQLDPEAEAEQERLEAQKLERQKAREEVAKQIAPSESKKKATSGKKKTESRLGIETAEDEKKRLLKYEETLPWILEDFYSTKTWVGNYEASLSECHVLLIRDESGFKLIPVEKSYRFKERDRFKNDFDADGARALLKKRAAEPKFVVDRRVEQYKARAQLIDARSARGLKTGATMKDEPEEIGFGGGGGGGDDDIDFDHDELFADDEENPIFEGDEDEQKDARERIFKDQRKANYFDLNDETAVLEQEERNQKKLQERKQLEKRTRKALIKKEGNYVYEDSDDENPYASESEDEDEQAAQLAAQQAEQEKTAESANLNGSTSSLKGGNTPLDRKKNLKANLKRPGSPNLSEASGNESTRKKAKLHKGIKRATDVDASGASGNESTRGKKTAVSKLATRGPMSLAASMRAGSGSDTDSVKRSRGKGKLSGANTPVGSRAQSPDAAAKDKVSRATSPAGKGDTPAGRAASPATGASGTSTPGAAPVDDVVLPSAEEVLALIPPGGIAVRDLIAMYKDTQKGWQNHHSKMFIASLKSVVKFNLDTKIITKK